MEGGEGGRSGLVNYIVTQPKSSTLPCRRKITTGPLLFFYFAFFVYYDVNKAQTYAQIIRFIKAYIKIHFGKEKYIFAPLGHFKHFGEGGGKPFSFIFFFFYLLFQLISYLLLILRTERNSINNQELFKKRTPFLPLQIISNDQLRVF